MSFPIIHGALSLDVPVLVIWGGGRKGEENDQGLTEAHLSTRANCVTGWTHVATTEMELLHSNIDFETQRSGSPTQERHQGHAVHTQWAIFIYW